MSLLPVRVDGTIQCHTPQQAEQHAFSYSDAASASTSTAASETTSLHSLVELLTAARNDSNRFFTAMIAKYPKAVAKGGSRRKKRDEDDEEQAADDEQDEAPQLDDSASHAAVTLPSNSSVPAAPASSAALIEPETKRPKLDEYL